VSDGNAIDHCYPKADLSFHKANVCSVSTYETDEQARAEARSSLTSFLFRLIRLLASERESPGSFLSNLIMFPYNIIKFFVPTLGSKHAALYRRRYSLDKATNMSNQ
jgi:hypothetical protein